MLSRKYQTAKQGEIYTSPPPPPQQVRGMVGSALPQSLLPALPLACTAGCQSSDWSAGDCLSSDWLASDCSSSDWLAGVAA